MLAVGEMCFDLGAVEKGVSTAPMPSKHILRAWGQLKRGFEVLALGEMCF